MNPAWLSARPCVSRRWRVRLQIAGRLVLPWLAGAVSMAGVCTPVWAQVAGQNVNMVSGTNWTDGDPFLQRQNEPSIAVSTRNTSHLVAGANDYRSVDLPGLLGIDERGDAWVGLFKSFDSGRTWHSTLLAGFPLDSSPEGQASPIHGFQAASDPVVRAGTNGLFYYVGLAYNRGANPLSDIFVSRLIDLNNKENGDAAFENGSMTNLAPRDTIKYIDTRVIGTGTSTVFLDKPWVAVDIPRGNSTCTISVNQDGQRIVQEIPAGAVYVTYTEFLTGNGKQVSRIRFKKSTDCGATWGTSRVLSENDEAQVDAEHQGTVIAIDPSEPRKEPATIYVAWRRFATPLDPDDPSAIYIVKSEDGGATWSEPHAIVRFPLSCNSNPTGVGCPFDQIFTTTSFRSNGYPGLAVDASGRVYVAWSQRDAHGDGKIMIGVSSDGEEMEKQSIAQVDVGPVLDDNGNPFSNLSGRGSQLMPSLNFNAGKLTLAYYDLRQDHTTGTFVEAANPGCDPLLVLPCGLGGQYNETRTLEGELASPNPANNPTVFTAYIEDSPPLSIRRHSIDLMAAEATPMAGESTQVPTFKSFRVSHYDFGSIPQSFQDIEQIQFNAPNLPLFVDGTAPFMGDYIDLAGTPEIVPSGNGRWTFNTDPSANPVSHVAWTDNRDVIPPADNNWQNYTPPVSASNPGGQPSKFDPTTTPPSCVVGQTGMRNQNVYSAEISQGVILTSPQSSKPVLTPAGLPIQRAFVVEVRNATNAARSFLLAIPNQPASAAASFQQFALQTTETVNVNAFSSQSLDVFVVANSGSTVAFPSVLVTAAENDGAVPPLTGSILLNPDPTNPALTSPDSALVGGNQISVNEFYNPGVASPGVASPGVASPGVASPGVASPGVASPGVASPSVVLALNPGVASPGVASPGVASPGVASPSLENQAVLTDATYAFTNEGNTSAAYTVQLFQSGAFPPGSVFQIILSRLYFTAQANGCQLQQVGTYVPVANVTNPAFITDPNQVGNPGVASVGLQAATLNLAPGESGQVTLRSNLTPSQVTNLVLPNVSPVAVSQAVNTVDVQQGITTPPISLVSTTVSLATGVTTQAYSATLAAVGGNGGNQGARTWSIITGSLPPGLQLNAATGAITGTPTTTGVFPFTAQVTDMGSPQHVATRNLSITVVAPVAFTTLSPRLPDGLVNSAYTLNLSAVGGVPPYTWTSAGTLPTGLTVSSSGVISGTPTTAGTFSFTVTATDKIGLFATVPYTIVISNGLPQGAQITFLVQPGNSEGGQVITPPVEVQLLDATGAPILNFPISVSFANQACAAATLSGTLSAVTNQGGVASFSNLSVDRGQFGYTLVASATNLAVASAPFSVRGYCASANLSTQREVQTQVLLGSGKVLIAGGVDNTLTSLTTADLYDPTTGTVTPTGNLTEPNGRANHASVVLPDGRVLLAGGLDNISDTATAELYDPVSGTFAATGSMSHARQTPSAVLLANGKVLVSGGSYNNVSLATAEIYDPATGMFTPTGSMNEPRFRHAMVLLPNDKVLVAGGWVDFSSSFAVYSSAEIFDPAANEGVGAFASIGNMNAGRSYPSATPLPNGTVLVAGGFTGGSAGTSLSSAEIFDPSTNAFTLTGSMSVTRARHSGTLLPDGTVLIAGGNDGLTAAAVVRASAEIYNPATGQFGPTGSMTTVREHVRSTLLNNGNVFVAGGDDGVNVLASTEIYYNTLAAAPLVVTTTSVPNGSISQPYGQQLFEVGGLGTLTWALANGTLPPGITLGSTGILSGAPTATGSFAFIVQVTDSSSAPRVAASQTLTINVSLSPLVFTSNTMPAAGSGRPYSQPLPVTGGTLPYTVTLTSGTLPSGLVLSANGVLSGTPVSAGSFNFTVNVVDSSSPQQSTTQALTISINTLFITTTVLPDGIEGVPYNAAISTVGGTLPLSFSLTTGAFPPGLTIQQPAANSPSRALSGTPMLGSAGIYTFSESVVDSSSPAQTATQYYTMTILPAGSAVPVSLTFVAEPQNSVGGQILTGSPIKVAVTDANNNPIAGAPVVLTFNGAPPCSTAVLSGTLMGITNGSGRAVFTDLSIDRGQTGYTLLASSGSATAVSQPFTVNGFCETKGSIGIPRQNLTATTLADGTVLIAGGGSRIPLPSGVSSPGLPFSSAELYNPLTGTFSFTGNMNVARWGHTATLLLDGRVLITGGVNSPSTAAGTVTNTAEIYDAANHTFTPTTGTMSSARFLHTATLLADGRVLIVGGATSVPPAAILAFGLSLTNTAEIFDPATGLFTPTSTPMSTARQLFTSTLLPNGQVLIAGGFSLIASLSSAEIFDPLSNGFRSTSSMTVPRALHVAALLPNGKVLLAGPDQTAEIYDPATATFAPTGNLAVGVAALSAAVLGDGTVLLPGGEVPGIATSSAQIYNPSTGTFALTGSLVAPISFYALAVLQDGSVLTAGGEGGFKGPGTISDSEIYYSTASQAALSVTTTSLSSGLGQLFNTGVNSSGAPLAAGATDPNYTITSITSVPGGGAQAATVQYLAGTWLPDNAVSQWIAPVTSSSAIGDFLYQTTFSLTGVNPATAQLSGSFAADNEATIFLNGVNTGITIGFNNGGNAFEAFTPFTINSGFVSGLNTLVIDVHNDGGPTGLRVQFKTIPLDQPYVQILLEQGGVGPLTWTLASGALPPGITLTPGGILIGTPTSAGTFTFAVQVTDSSTPPKIATSANLTLQVGSP